MRTNRNPPSPYERLIRGGLCHPSFSGLCSSSKYLVSRLWIWLSAPSYPFVIFLPPDSYALWSDIRYYLHTVITTTTYSTYHRSSCKTGRRALSGLRDSRRDGGMRAKPASACTTYCVQDPLIYIPPATVLCMYTSGAKPRRLYCPR